MRARQPSVCARPANLLAGTQQQLANGRLDSMARDASQLSSEERAQEARINKLANAGQPNAGQQGSAQRVPRTLPRLISTT